MSDRLLDDSILAGTQNSLDYLTDVFVASTEYSIIGEDLEGKVLSWNEGARRLYGYEPEEVVGKVNSFILHTPEDIKMGKPRKILAAALHDGKWEGTVTRVRKNGDRFTARMVLTTRRDAQGQVVGFLLISKNNGTPTDEKTLLHGDSGVVEVVTEIRREEALLKAGALQNAIFNSANFSSIATDAKGVIQIFNVGAERMLGYGAAEVMNKITPADISDPQEVIARAEALSVELRTPIAPGFEALVFKASRGIEDIYELTYIRKDGSRFPAVVSVTALRDAQDAIIGYLLIGTDNTARKQAEAALLKAGALQSAIFNSANFSSIATDAKGVIQIFNVGAERMLGYSAAEVMNKITPADISDPQEMISRATALSAELGTRITPGFEALVFKASRGIEDIYELTYIRKDGNRFPAVVSVTALRDTQAAIIGYLLIGTDNTARRQAHDERNRFFALSQDMLCTLGFDGYFKDLNPAWEKTLGFTKAEILSQPFIDFVHPEDRQETLAEAQSVFGGKSLHNFENRYRCKDGTYRYFLWSATAIIEDQLMYGAARDITERKQAEAALLKAGALQSAIFNSANFSSIATDAKGVIQIFNVGAERMLGYTAAEVVNKITPAELSDPQELIARAQALSLELGTMIAPGFEALVYKASRGIEDIYELTKLRKDGSRFPAMVSVTALRDAQDTIIGYLLIGTDNTARQQVEAERKKLDQRLRDQQFYTRSLIESNIDALVTTDPLGIITDVNKQMEALTDCTRDELIGAPFKNYFTDLERAEAGIKLVLSERKVTDYELTACSRDGKETVVSYNATTFYDRERKLQGVFAAARDVTERKRFEQTLQEKNVELERANLAKDRFLASMSHELRTPLNAIIGFTGTLLMKLPGPLNGDQEQQLSTVQGSARHLLSLINDLLDLAKIESGKVEIRYEPIVCQSVVEEVASALRPLAEGKGLEFQVVAPKGSVRVESDRRILSQILINLTNNAIKFTDRGKVQIELGTRLVNGHSLVTLDVIDTGVGIRAKDQEKLFQAFQQVETDRRGEGTGLGLYLSQKLSVLIKGTIELESEYGGGSVFRLLIPQD
jgi:PAS domain S-box-containing protein